VASRFSLFGFLATFPATLILVGWLYLQRATNEIYDNYFLISATVAAILLLIIGIVASKLIFDYLRTEDERRIWLAADKALFHARRLLIQKPRSRYYV
jgi:biotin transporter BioY